jgi:hypothetical protein
MSNTIELIEALKLTEEDKVILRKLIEFAKVLGGEDEENFIHIFEGFLTAYPKISDEMEILEENFEDATESHRKAEVKILELERELANLKEAQRI